MHMEAAAAPFLFLLGIAAGVMARRSGGLLAAMILHAAFNIIGGLAFLM
jgi:membrane protease YdiL (CAAX protease family)